MHSNRGIYAPIMSREERKAAAEVRLAELLHRYAKNHNMPHPDDCPLCKRVGRVRRMNPIVSAAIGGAVTIAAIWILARILEQF